MWYEQRNGFVRVPVPTTFDRRVEQLENRDSVLFESISLPSLAPGATTKSSRSQNKRVIDLSDDFVSDDEPVDSVDLQRRELLDRVHRLEAECRQKDAEIARLREELQKQNNEAATRISSSR
jgi:hypothetical protein